MESKDEMLKRFAEYAGVPIIEAESMLKGLTAADSFKEFSIAAASVVSAQPRFRRGGTNKMPKKKKRKKR